MQAELQCRFIERRVEGRKKRERETERGRETGAGGREKERQRPGCLFRRTAGREVDLCTCVQSGYGLPCPEW